MNWLWKFLEEYKKNNIEKLNNDSKAAENHSGPSQTEDKEKLDSKLKC